MFKQSSAKLSRNPLRYNLQKKGYSVRAAARALGIHITKFVHQLDTHEPGYDLEAQIQALPDAPVKGTPDTLSTKKPPHGAEALSNSNQK